MKSISFYTLILMVLIASCRNQSSEEKVSYRIDSIPTPAGLTAEVSALEFLEDGRLVAAFMRGEILFYQPETEEWEVFATGLHEPLGMKVISAREILVMQLPELTLLKDTDGDGRADVYETIYDDFGMTGNYHEFAYGPVQDKQGNLYVALNASSSGGGISKETRGDKLMIGKSETSKAMFSVVPYRGWVMKIDTNYRITPVASGLRSPNGMVFDANDELYVTENQGDWVGSSALYHVQQDKFYGHPSSLVWTDGWDQGNPFDLTVDELDSMREKPAVIFPHDVLANSPSQPILIKDHKQLETFDGQLIVGEMSSERLVRIMLEKVNGVMQGAATVFIQGEGLRKGNNRLAFAPNGDLWVGQADHGWLGDRGIQRISFTNKMPFEVRNMKLQKEGFEIEFTKPIQKNSILADSVVRARRYRYHYHEKYGSPQVDAEAVPIIQKGVSNDGKKLQVHLEKLDQNFVYEISLDPIISEEQQDTLKNKSMMYTIKELL
ncbi:MAG: DUF7133 domain-containing protein [Sphingobacterium sp.]